MPRTIKLRTVLPYTQEKVWAALTNPKLLGKWVDPPGYISHTYRGEATGEKTLACAGIHSEAADTLAKGIFAKLDTVLSFTLEPTCGGTILSMEHSGYEGFKLYLISIVMKMGWKKQLKKKLPRVLDQMS